MEATQPTDQLYRIRHSLAHVLAQAVCQIRPEAQLAFGPPIDNGCYYDFLFQTPLSDADFPDIEKRMRRIIAERQEFQQSELPAKEALEVLANSKQSFKVEYAQELIERGESVIGFYKNGPFEDMCAGPHLEHTGQIPPDCFTIDTLAGAYWRGSEKNPQLTRIYLLAFSSKAELQEYQKRRELARQRDHRKLGTELDLFSINQEQVGAGLILWHPKGAIVRHLIEEHAKKRHLESGYDFVYSPHIGRATLWETSGHLEFYKEGMFSPIEVEGQEFYLKPMNCPFHCHIYKSSLRSYRDLPKRFAEWGTVYRFERSGTLHGLTRVRGFTQDDAHIFCDPQYIGAEIDQVLSFSLGLLRDFGLTDFKLYLSTRPAERVGDEAKWDLAESSLRNALERSSLPFAINEGDGAFYGPKIDVCVIDALGREWQLSTIQFDFNLPERFQLSFTGEDGQLHQPFMVHRALLGSIERFFGILLEHLGGAFPTWLAPVQARIIPVSEKFTDYAKQLADDLSSRLFRVELDSSDNTFNKKIRQAVTQKIPNIVIIGGREVETEGVTLRRYCVEKQESLTKADFIDRLERLRKERIMDNDPAVVV